MDGDPGRGAGQRTWSNADTRTRLIVLALVLVIPAAVLIATVGETTPSPRCFQQTLTGKTEVACSAPFPTQSEQIARGILPGLLEEHPPAHLGGVGFWAGVVIGLSQAGIDGGS